jgi:hypothetical protein
MISRKGVVFFKIEIEMSKLINQMTLPPRHKMSGGGVTDKIKGITPVVNLLYNMENY